MNVFGFNIKPHDIWANRSRQGQFQIDGMTADEWVAAHPDKTFDDFWHVERTQRLQSNFEQIWNSSSKGTGSVSNFPIDGVFRMLGSTNNQAVMQTLGSIKQWETFAEIQANGGKAIGFDLETFGDITKAGTDPSQFGITEFAIGTRTYDGTGNIERAGRSYILGINDAQAKYLNELSKKFATKGWNALEESEQVALGRISMYGSKGAVLSEVIDGKTIYVAGTLGTETRTVDAINAGIKKLQSVYTDYSSRNIHQKDIFAGLVNQLIEANKASDTVLFGANSKFDIDALVNTAKTLGMDTSEINAMRQTILDVVYSARALATSNSQSVNEYFHTMYGVKAGASVDDQLRAMHIDSTQLHQGYEDVVNEGRLIDIRAKEILESKAKLEETQAMYKKYGNLDDSVFLVHRGKLNQEFAQEMGIIDGTPVPNYSFTNEYWTVDTEHSRYVDIDGEQKYALALNSYVDGESTSVVLIRDSQEEAMEQLTRNSSVFHRSQITSSDALGQQAFKYKDFGRREFDKLISPSAVGLDNGQDAYGFETLKKYLSLVDTLEADVTDSKSIQALANAVDADGNKIFKSYYQAQAYAGMYDKIRNEKVLLQGIVDQVNDTYGSASNIDKTIVARQAYTRAIEHLDSTYARKQSGDVYDVMSDALGIDVVMPDESIRRINGYNADSIASDVNRIFKGLSPEDINGILTGLNDKGLFVNEDAYAAIAKRIATMSSDDLYGISQDIGYELSQVTQGYIDKNESIIEAFRKGKGVKNEQFLGQKLETDRIITYEGKTFSEAYAESANAISGIISDAVQNRPDTIYLNTVGQNDTVFKNYINKIASQLNIEQMAIGDEAKTSGDLLYQLFTQTKNFKGEKTKYAINNYIDQGLSTFMTVSDNGAYLFLTREQDAAKFYANLIDGKFDLSSKASLVDPKKSGYLSVNDYATVVEIPKINQYELASGTLQTIKQGQQEKFIIPELRVTQEAGKPMRAYYNTGDFGYFSTLRMSMGGAIQHTLHGEYAEGTSVVRKAQNRYLDDLASSSSYRGRVLFDADGKVIGVERIAEFTPSDFIQASEAKITDGLYDLFKGAAQIDPGRNLNTAQKIVMAFGAEMGQEFRPGQDQIAYMNKIMSGAEFREFFTKRLFTGAVSDDMYMGALKGPGFDKNIFQIIKDMASDETTHIFDKSVRKALNQIPTDVIINQVLSETALEKGIVSYGVRPGDYNDAASLYSTMRPTYVQQNNALSFTLSEMDNTKFVGFKAKPVRFDTAVSTAMEYEDRMALATSGYQPIAGQDYAARRRSMVARVKQMSDYDLQLRYQDMWSDVAGSAKSLGISQKKYRDALTFFQENYMSLHEGKVFLAPGLNEQKLFQDVDGKKVLYNLDGLDIDRSESLMKKLVYNKEIVTRDTVIGIRKNGTVVFHQGPDVVFTEANLQDFFGEEARLDPTGIRKSYAIPVRGDIADKKIMINGAEKGTTHSISMTSFMKYTGINDYSEALRVANSLFDRAFDGAAAVAKFGFENHGNIVSTHSLWNTITSNYIENGLGKALTGQLNRMILEEEAFAGMQEFRFINGELLSSSSNAHNFSAAVELLYDRIKSNSILDSKVNGFIVSEINSLYETNTYNAIIQRQNMNEHMGTRMVIDQRIEQGIRTRGMQMGRDGMEQIDNDWADALKAYSQGYTAKGTGLNKDTHGYLKEFIDVFGASKNAERVHLLTAKTETQRSAKGIIESMMYYYNPQKYSPDNKNIVRININDLMDEGIRLKGGLSAKELHNSIFFVDGKPSEFLEKAAQKSGVNLREKSYSIFIELNGTSFTLSEKAGKETLVRKFDGVMIPIQTVFDDINDKVYFQSQQKSVASFINDLVDITANPHKYKNQSDALATSYSGLMKALSEQIGYLDKDSDVYKAFQQYIMPTSQELLAQDEIAPLVQEMMNADMRNLIDDKYKYEKILELDPDDKVAIGKLQEVYDKLYGNKTKNITGKLTDIAQQIRTDNNYYSTLMSLGGERLTKASEVIINGKKQYGLAIAISKKAFEAQGISVGAVGLDVFSDWETGSYKFENIKNFASNKPGGHNFAARKTTIARRLNAEIEGLNIDASKSITDQLNAYIKEQYGSKGILSIKDLNKAMIEKEPSKILKIFDEEIGSLYLSEVGTFGELTRYPSFRSQPIVRVILDESLEGKQIRGSSAVLSSLTNVDFDGDKIFLAMITDGISIANEKTQIKLEDGRSINVLDTQRALFERFATRESRGLLAELVEKGEVFDVNNPNAITRQYAAMLKKMKTDSYEEAVMSWAKDNSIRGSFKEISKNKAYIFAAESSKQMHDTFVNMGFNTMTDMDSTLASIASRFRKKNIGAISTPNYHMRNALLEAMQDPGISLQQKQLLNDTYVSLSNMLSKAGGFFSEAEQKSIDVKHAQDGLEIARTTRYSAGMSKLFGRGEHDVKNNVIGIRNILEATNSGLFKATNQELHTMENLVANTTLEDFNKNVVLYDADIQEHLRTLRKLLDVQKEIPNFDQYYANTLIKGTVDADIFDFIRQIEKLNESNITDLQKQHLGTGFYNVLDVFADSFSADKSRFVQNNVYFQVGDINGEWISKAYLHTGNNNFVEIDVATGNGTGNLFRGNRDELFDAGGINVRDYIELAEIRATVNDRVMIKKFENTLNSVLLDKNGHVVSKMPESFIKVGNHNGGIGKYGSVWIAVNGLFTGKASQGRQTSTIYENIAKMARAYDYAVTKNVISTEKHPDSSGELIKKINRDIAANPRSRNAESGFIFSEEYDTILRKEMSKVFGTEDILDRYIKEAIDLPDFDGAKYKESLDFLKANTYDIIEQQKAISGSIASVQTEFDGLRKQGASSTELKPLKDILDASTKTSDDMLKALRKENASVIKGVQKDIYSLFTNTSQMNTYFGWSKPSHDSVVGFGEYIGKTFKSLSKTDMQAILEAGEIAKKSMDSMTAKEQFAVTHTLDALKNYKANATHSARTAMKTSETVNDFIQSNQKAIQALHDQLEKRTPEQTKEAAKRAASETVQKKKLSGVTLDGIKSGLDKLPKGTVAVAAASLAAIGIANNLLHNQKNQSPLSPARKPNRNDHPSLESPAGPTQAPMSQRRTVYHDNSSGFNFKVSAKTNQYINDMNNAKLIGMSGGGNSSVYSQADMSGVTDNWLANKFAELT